MGELVALIRALPEGAHVFAVGVLTGASLVGSVSTWWAVHEGRRSDRWALREMQRADEMQSRLDRLTDVAINATEALVKKQL